MQVEIELMSLEEGDDTDIPIWNYLELIPILTARCFINVRGKRKYFLNLSSTPKKNEHLGSPFSRP